MSGRSKRVLYYIITAVCLLAALAACMLMFYSAYRTSEQILYPLVSLLAFCGVYVLTAPCVLVHECGHLLFGLCARMKVLSVRAGWLYASAVSGRIRFGFSPVAGKTELLPCGEEHVRGRMMAISLGGATLNFLFGIIFCVLFFVLPVHPVLLFFEFFAPFHLFEGISALLPAELHTGRTDGELFRILKADTADAKVYLNVLTAEGILYSSTFDDVKRELLFDTPVVREDGREFLALLGLRWQYLMWKDEVQAAAKELFRLEELSGYLEEEERAQVKCDAVFMRRILNMEEETEDRELRAAKGTLSYLRAELAMGEGDIDRYKKIAAQEVATGIKALELKSFERFIQNF